MGDRRYRVSPLIASLGKPMPGSSFEGVKTMRPLGQQLVCRGHGLSAGGHPRLSIGDGHGLSIPGRGQLGQAGILPQVGAMGKGASPFPAYQDSPHPSSTHPHPKPPQPPAATTANPHSPPLPHTPHPDTPHKPPAENPASPAPASKWEP